MPLSRRTFIRKSAAAATGLAMWQTDPAKGKAKPKRNAPQIEFAVAEIAASLAHTRHAPLKVAFQIDAAHLQPQCYKITPGHGGHILVTGGDANAAMYGGLDVAEAVRLGTVHDLKEELHTPCIAQRGIKFNIPLDVRTPSYSDAGDAAQHNIPEMWSTNFWRTFLDEMARDRFNVLTLWNLHPFPSIVKVPDYPDVALNDVQRTTAKFDGVLGGEGREMVTPVLLAHTETLKTLTIEEKIAFWRAIMQYAHDRGIGVYWFTWNIFVWGANGKHGITSHQDNPITMDYFRKSVRETLLTYPLLQGFGITAGENMQNLTGDYSNERWLWKTYGEGIVDVKKLQPERSIRLIHRFHYTNLSDITQTWKAYPDTFDFSYKYSVAHMYSSLNPPFIKDTLAALPSGQRTWLTVRNDDIYSFRWGDPDYARAYVQGMPGPNKLAGFYMGPDGYIWGREFLSTEPDAPRQLVIQKQWYSFLLWGRLSYDPALPNSLFERLLAARFPEADGAKLFAAFQSASKVVPQITRFFWGGNGNDFEWFPEACVRKPGGSAGFYTVTDFMRGHTMSGAGVLNIADYVEKWGKSEAMGRQTPPEVAQSLSKDAYATFALLAQMQPPKDKELRLTCGDLAAMAHLGHYYAAKISGATELALFEKTSQPERQASAVRHLEAALAHWKKYADVYSRQYQPQRLTRIGMVNIPELTASVQQDIEIARSTLAQPHSPTV